MADLSKDVLMFSKEFARMCNAHPYTCEGCLADETGRCEIAHITPELIDAVQKWSDEHPQKTYAQDFKDKFPKYPWDNEVNAPLDMCRDVIYEGLLSECTSPKMCSECWNELMPEDNNA